MIVFGQKWLYSGKSGCLRRKVVGFWKSGSNREKWLYSAKVVVFGQSGCNWAKCLHSGKVVLFGQKLLYLGKSVSGKVVVIGQKWLYSGKSS